MSGHRQLTDRIHMEGVFGFAGGRKTGEKPRKTSNQGSGVVPSPGIEPKTPDLALPHRHL